MAQAQQAQTQKSPDEATAELLSMLIEHSEELKGLLEQLIELKRSGIIDSLMLIVNRFDELLEYLFQEPTLFRLLSILVDGGLGAVKNLDTSDVLKIKDTLRTLGSCVGKNISPETITNAQPVKGLMGLWRALGDPDVQRGLGIALALLKQLGKCSQQK